MRDWGGTGISEKVTLLSNSAQCFLKLKHPKEAKEVASRAIALAWLADDANIDQTKLYYRRAEASEHLHDFSAALGDMQSAYDHAMRKGCVATQQWIEGAMIRIRYRTRGEQPV